MATPAVERRVTRLEDLMADLLQAVIRTEAQVEQTSRELRAFKDEMRAFKDEMLDFKEESRISRKAMDRRWGELANKMGTMAEDLVAPSIGRILRTAVQCPEDRIESIAVRVRRRHPQDRSQMQEFDVVAACSEYVLINETKSSLNAKDIDQFIEVMSRARAYFPEYADKKFVGAIASLYVEPSIVRHGERQGLIVLGTGEELMDVLNSPEFRPKVF